VRALITGYTRESGVRQLEREIGRLARKVARKIAAEELESAEIKAKEVKELLGRPKVHPEQMAEADQVGVATGMFYTPVGGDIMFVEASPMAGKGNLVLTGQLGDVMRESAEAALSWVRANAEHLALSGAALESSEIHLHVPAGAVPKDGPSAGIALVTALVSALSGRRARGNVAMSGEISLRGRVLPVGGIKAKVLGAARAGIQTVLLPRRNEKDLVEIPPEVREKVEIQLVESIDEVLERALDSEQEA